MSRRGPLTPGIAVITGGARGLGNAIAISFAKDGAKGVAIIDIQDEQTMAAAKKEIEAVGATCLTIRADVTDEKQVEQAIASVVEKFGRIDYAANFAGILGPQGMPTWEVTLEGWQQGMGVNSTGVFLCMKHELRQMIKQSSIDVESGRVPQLGSIVNCASVNSIQAGAGATTYTASKHAVMGMTKAAALEARSHNIRVNAVSPGFLFTKLVSPTMEAGGEAGAKIWKAFEARQGRAGTFDEIGDVVVLLSTPRMSLVNGHNLVIDGGFTINEGTD